MSSVESGRKNDNSKAGERQLLGVGISDVLKTSMGVMLGILGTLFVGWWTAKEPHLRYSVSEPIQFPGEKLKVGIVNVFVTNDGSKEAKSLEVSLGLKGTKIQEVKTSPEIMKPIITITGDKCFLTLPILNQGETLQVSTFAYDADKLDGKPNASVRAGGAVGDNQTNNTSRGWWDGFSTGVQMVLVFVSVVFTAFTYSLARIERRRRRAKKSIDDETDRRLRKQYTEAALGYILRTDAGRKLIPAAIDKFSPGRKFSPTELAEATGIPIANLSDYLPQLEHPYKSLGVRALETDEAGRLYFEEDSYKMI